LPFEECTSPSEPETSLDTESSSKSSSGDDDEEEDNGQASGGADTELPQAVSFAALRNLLKKEDTDEDSAHIIVSHHIAPDSTSVQETMPTTEMAQLQKSITEIVSHLYRVAMVIRHRPRPHDRLVKSARIDVSHYEGFDRGFVQDCYPCATPELRNRLAKAITRRRADLVYSRRHHQALLRPRQPSRSTEGQAEALSTLESFFDPPIGRTSVGGAASKSDTPFTNPSSSRHGLSTQATEFIPPNNTSGEETDFLNWEVGTQSSYGSTVGGGDVIQIPPRPFGSDGKELAQFECPYCFRLVEIHSSRGWR
jgi:hypothetical protein